MRFDSLQRNFGGSNAPGGGLQLRIGSPWPFPRAFVIQGCGAVAVPCYGDASERAATSRCDLGFRIASSNRTIGQVDQVPHTKRSPIARSLARVDAKKGPRDKFLEPVFEPLLAAVVCVSQQKRAAHAACHAVVPASQRRINQLSASDSRKRFPAASTDYCTHSQYALQDRFARASARITISARRHGVGTVDRPGDAVRILAIQFRNEAA
jgi:hypothetical protein